MSDIPGGEEAMASRPVHFFWLLDCSGSMSINGKISILNGAIRDAIPAMQDAAGANPKAQLFVRVVTFSSGARWHVLNPVPVEQFTWSDVTADGTTDLGEALRLVAGQLEIPPMPERALPPVLALLSDGQPSDDYRSGLQAIDATGWGRRAVRVAVKIGSDAEEGVLQEFLKNPEIKPLEAKNAQQLAAAIRWISTVVDRPEQALGAVDTGSTGPTPTLVTDDAGW
jgi:uncharacterized protein YegL